MEPYVNQTSLFEIKEKPVTPKKNIRLELDEILKNLQITRGIKFKKKSTFLFKTKPHQ
jgi:hypothetical protein